MIRRFTGYIVTLGLVGFNLGFTHPTSPIPERTPGSYCTPQDHDFAEYRYAQKIPYCTRNVTTGEKTKIYQAYGIPRECRGYYTIDHLIPLSIGGNNVYTNLWPEHKAIKALRQNLEYDLFLAVGENRMTQQEAVKILFDAKFHPPIEKLNPNTPCL